MKNKRVSIFGYGVTTKPLTKHIKNAVFYDDKCSEPYAGINGSFVRPSHEFDPDNSDLEITSPGIPPSNPLIQKAQNLMSEYDYFKDTKPFKIWISGTNGKTTTTQMMQHLLEDKGSVAGGNIGTALGDLEQEKNMWILETSSFTMHYTSQAFPDVYVLLPLSPDHLTWHGSMQEYVADKLKPLSLMKATDIAIIPAEYANTPTNATILSYEDEESLAKLFEIDMQKVNFKGAFLLDALLAMSVDKLRFKRTNYEKMNSFKLDPHRQEELRDAKNRLWINDTKATNLDATIAALKRYEDSFIHLILGGDDKGVDLNELFLFLKEKQLKIYAIGSNKEKLSKLASDYAVAFAKCINLSDAISKIDRNLQKNEVALLSPAASSLDEFSSYAQRGNEFKEAVTKLS
ncbi:UDP-N-acetylmuramoyl-L-alanine--D-glutamate ligase [Sulfurimonas sp.]|jgi:UDP-N-acetylmuramoylalanine--D-glutamate ligase|uniref:UDP-N-acetylmuramoyl-L-alanine--D-glutamate ligase n=1 Tax=Sulfurimonas sp. TaxID=2022749 RepID=UPI0025D54164|nr:UDP-N-acetylmuramoyl-L-alanine--D-glutamate ligase [Sulfurimonas sp.]MBT5935659.1 UDP-N-acetylmuramoyl-L-alanine--D-glutamate ligase [Sulfurimonas sp.]